MTTSTDVGTLAHWATSFHLRHSLTKNNLHVNQW